MSFSESLPLSTNRAAAPFFCNACDRFSLSSNARRKLLELVLMDGRLTITWALFGRGALWDITAANILT